tara:strand:- start:3015 stop:3206 length:192 start_codon:yes stop_codon:yes gene_type:complete
MLEPFSLVELSIFIGSCFASIGGLIFSISKSRCTSIKCCGCIIERDVIPIDMVTDPTLTNRNE